MRLRIIILILAVFAFLSALSGIKELRQVLETPTLQTIFQANQILDDFNRSFELEVTYLMDQSGTTIYSSNRNATDSFVGKDFSFRPYYEKGIQGLPSAYLALGTTSGKRPHGSAP